jgi:hypothetical protein
VATPRGVRIVALIGALVLAGAGVGLLLVRRNRPPLPPATPPSDLVSTPQHFRSSEGLALDYKAPPGWRLEHQPNKSQLVVIEGSGSLSQAARALFIRSSLLPKEPDVDGMLETVRQSLSRGAGDVQLEPPQPEMVAGKPGKGFVARSGGRAMWQVVVVRNPRRAASLQCITHAELDPREVCSEALAGISWLEP